MPALCRCHILGAALSTALCAQNAQIVQGAHLGVVNAGAVGDVNGDGFGDYMVDLGPSWEVRSGATGLALPALSRLRVTIWDFYTGLFADLDADGHDDLCFQTPGSGSIEFHSGRDGSLRFSFADPRLRGGGVAADHDSDGADDVMVFLDDTANSVKLQLVLSGQNGAVLETFQFPYLATSQRWMSWVGDVDGDGHCDIAFSNRSFGQPFVSVLAGPDRQRGIYSGGDEVWGALDTNGDGRDELLTPFGYLDAVTAQLVWPGFNFQQAPPMDLDGDGAMDMYWNGLLWSGRTQTVFPGVQVPGGTLGDIDGDGRDELVHNGYVYELAGGPPSSRVRDRGASGTTSNTSRPRIRHRLRPRLGDAMLVDLHGGGAGGFAFLAIGTALDLDLAPFGAPGNRAYVLPFGHIGRVADAHGLARSTLAVPNAPVLVGTAASLQWAVFDPAANALGLATSNALDVVVGH